MYTLIIHCITLYYYNTLNVYTTQNRIKDEKRETVYNENNINLAVNSLYEKLLCIINIQF